MDVRVAIGDNTREIIFTGSSLDELKAAILERFADILKTGDQISHLKIWNERLKRFVTLGSRKITGGCKLEAILDLAKDSTDTETKTKEPGNGDQSKNAIGQTESGDPSGAQNIHILKSLNECETCLKTPSPPEPLDSGKKSGQGAIFPGNHIWGKSILYVFFLNSIPSDWLYRGHKMTVVSSGSSHVINFLDIFNLANCWTTKLPLSVPREKREKVPTFVPVSDPQQSDIRVWFQTRGGCSTLVGTKANAKPKGGKEENATMFLNLGGCDDRHKEHLVMHEFGHALGIGHEHQRAVFWISMKKFFKPDVVENFFGDQFDEDVAPYGDVSGLSSEYDPHSIMHYWFDRAWLQDKYNSFDKVRDLPSDGGITEDERVILEGFYQRTRERGVADELSEKDLEYIVKAYNGDRIEDTEFVPELNRINLSGLIVSTRNVAINHVELALHLKINLRESEQSKQRKELFTIIEDKAKSGEMTWDSIVDALERMNIVYTAEKIKKTCCRREQSIGPPLCKKANLS